jgi:hypothetical protein
MNPRAKGIRFELKVRNFLREHGFEAIRGQQHSGAPGSPDVIHNIPGVHIEAKHTQRTDLYGWMKQATRDAGDKIPVIFHQKDYEHEMLVIMRASDWIKDIV